MAHKFFLEGYDLSELAEKVYRDNPKATLWDVLVKLLTLKSGVEPIVIWILSDWPIIELVAKGYDRQYIADFLEISPKTIGAVCRTWGLVPFAEILDFDPTSVYVEDMTVDDLQKKLEPVLAIMPPLEILEDCIINVQKYLKIKQFLNDWEK